MPKHDSFFLEGKLSKGVVLCHTLAGSPDQMREIAKQLNKKGYFVSCPLYKGHDLEFNELIKTQVTDWYQDVLTTYDELAKKVEKIYVVGMSIGGTFTVKLAQERDVAAIATINAPIIGFDIENDVFQYRKLGNSEELTSIYRHHRSVYFDFVTKLGQINEIQKITCPLFTLQGSLDLDRYKTSTQMLMFYASSERKQRKDYSRSKHLLLLENDRKEAIKDIIDFFEEN